MSRTPIAPHLPDAVLGMQSQSLPKRLDFKEGKDNRGRITSFLYAHYEAGPAEASGDLNPIMHICRGLDDRGFHPALRSRTKRRMWLATCRAVAFPGGLEG